MKKRIISSIFIVAFTLAFVLLKQVHCLFFDAFALVISYISLREIIKAQGEGAVEKQIQWALYVVPGAQFLIYHFANNYLALVLNIALAVVLFYRKICLATQEIENLEQLNQMLKC